MALYTRLTTALFAVLAALAALAGLTALAGPASAEDGFRYWGYYHLTGDRWEASTKGANNYTAEDGDVEGFRYATTTGTMPSRPPRAVPSFQEICAGTDSGQGEKRVGLVLDYGTPQDATDGDAPPPPEAACAVVPADATTQQALESVKPLRVEDGLMCAIDGYPTSGCAEQVKDVTVPQQEKRVDLVMPADEGGDSGAGSGGGVGSGATAAAVAAAVVLLGAGGFLLARRRAA
jgi:hypothetical protein